MRHAKLFIIIPILVLLSRPSIVNGFQLPAQPPLPNFDGRQETGQATVEQLDSVTQLRGLVPKLRVEFDPVTAAPKSVSAMDETLTAPSDQQVISAASRAAFTGTSDSATRAFLYEHRALFGHGPEALDAAQVVRDDLTSHNGVRTVVWQQQVDGIRVFEAVLVSHTTSGGELVNLASQFVPNPDQAADNGTPNRLFLEATPDITARQAVALAAQNLGVALLEDDVTPIEQQTPGAEQRQKFTAPGLSGEVDAQLIWLPMDRNTLFLCWDAVLMSQQRGEMFRVLLDARSGNVIVRRCLTSYLTDATYNVYTSDSPSPFSPGWPTPNSGQPPQVSRTLLTLSALDTNASPAGWINDGGNETLGNNVDAHTDRNADNLPDLPRPQGAPFRVFDFPMNLATQDPTNYSQAAVVQLFYLCNRYHDLLYQLGFTESAGNFQSNNFGRGGVGNDAVQADAQDGSGTDNANFSTPPDGSPGRMQMYLFTGPSPRRDGDLDAEIVYHEHTHGLSWRLVGGGQALGDTQSDGMGEGWSDFYGLALLSEPGDDVNGNYAAGGYATYQLAGLTQNYYFGIRRYPYTTDLTKNPLTFKDIDPAQASAHTGIPRNPIIGSTADEVHNEGEVWCVTLWEARANLVNKYGWAVGNQLMLKLATDGMKLTPPHPNFLQARNGILQADVVDTGGANRIELWTAFAKRGMGFNATSPVSSTTAGLHESFDLPDDLQITPGAGLDSSGQVGGPFTPTCTTYAVTNTGTNLISWAVGSTQPWLDLSTSGGTLPVGGSGSVNVCLNPAASTLAVGNYAASVLFSNLTSGVVISRSVTLQISPPRVAIFTLDTDPGWTRQGEWAFGKPAGLGGTSFGRPDPTGGFTGTNVFGINLNGDYSTTIGGPYYLTAGPFNLATVTATHLQFRRWLNTDYQPYVYATVEISTNGTTWTTFWNNGTSPVADAAWTTVSYDISTYADKQSTVYIRWGHRIGNTGAFPYSGWNLDDIELQGMPSGPLNVTLPASAAENAGVITNGGSLLLGAALPTNLVVSLTSSVPARLMVPPTVTIPAGAFSASFNLILVDNAIVDGNQAVVVTAGAPGFTNVIASTLVLDDEVAPTITVQPANVTATTGGTATFNVTASGKTPLSYFWRRNGTTIPGANSPSYTTNNVQPSDAGALFSCVVTNVFGTALSSNATLAVLGPFFDDFEPGIDLPQWSAFGGIVGSTVVATNYGGSVSGINSLWFGDSGSRFAASRSLDASSGGSVDFWLRISNGASSPWENVDLPDEGIVLEYSVNAGATWVEMGRFDTSTYWVWTHVTIPIPAAAQTASTRFQWRQLLNSGTGFDHWALDDVAVITGPQPPIITAQPTNQTVVIGNSATFGVTAGGSVPLSYFWQRNGTPIPGANNSTYTTNNVQLTDTSAQFSCLVSNVNGTLLSSNGVLTVVPGTPPSITFQPANLTAASGGSATFSVTATGSAPLSYFWRRGGTPIPGANGSSYTTNNVQLTDSGSQFSCIVSNAFGSTPSSNATLTVICTIGISTQPVSQITSIGGSATFSLIATGSPPFSYTWRRNGSPIAGAANISSYTTNNVQLSDSGALFSCLVSNSCGSILSTSATLTVTVGPVFLTGNYLYLPINTNGVFLANNTGGKFNAAGTGGATGVDFWFPGAPIYNYSVGVASINHLNGSFTSLTLSNLSTASLQRAVLSGTVIPGLLFSRDISFATNSKVITIVDTLKNTGVSALNNVVTMDSTDPDQDSPATSGTLNDVLSVNATNDLVVASGPNTGLSLGFGSGSGLQIPSAVGFNNTDAYSFLTVIDPNGTNADIDINLVQNYGTLAAGQTRSVTWYMVFGISKAEVTNLFKSTSGGPPAISQQPVGSRISPGCAVTLGVTASGAVPLRYQWWKNNSPLGSETNASLVLSTVQAGDFATYFAVITNNFGSITSSNATLSENHPPLTGQDIIQRLSVGDVKVQVFTLLANDLDLDGDTVTFVGVNSNSVAGGTVYRSGAWVYYVPPVGYTNSDMFTYTVSDGFCGGTVVGNVLVQIMTPSGPSHNFSIYPQPDGSIRLVFAGVPGLTYRIQYSDALLGANWINLGTRTADSLGVYEFIDTPPSGTPTRFYRSVWP